MQKAILQLKATLIATDPPVWRRIRVPAEYSFANLHAALQDAFGWTDSHLHHFLTANPFKRNAAYKRISLPMPDIDLPDEEPSLDELKEKISAWLVKPEDTVYYEYDFGDSWMHEVKLEKICRHSRKNNIRGSWTARTRAHPKIAAVRAATRTCSKWSLIPRMTNTMK